MYFFKYKIVLLCMQTFACPKNYIQGNESRAFRWDYIYLHT